ncbi:WD40 repeat-like protein [Sistotremastrum niveocremeum HHB9708]|uniref:WD40 repeat-like protein n=1 Tax=Sistotremastrum niveocremeum HHB9708 TaxID=1314777 RepID=A0A164RJF5_9AGAM|nr:WD40 repeat-like protein [Sistotremastrum niveocremeum HHB9708]
MNYALAKRLTGHSATVNCFAFDSQGQLMASGGDDQRVIIWSMDKLVKFQEISNDSWGQITCLQWLGEESSASKTLCFGCGRGLIHLYHQTVPGEKFTERCTIPYQARTSIEAMAYDTQGRRLVVATAHGDIGLWLVPKGGGAPSQSWNASLFGTDAVVRGLVFDEDQSSVDVFCTETGTIHTFDIETGTQSSTPYRIAESRIGSICHAPTKRYVLIDNLGDGCSMYHYTKTKLELVRSFDVIRKGKLFPFKAVFAESATLAVSGSDHGKVYIFDATTSRLTQVLCHGKASVQTVGSFSYSDQHLIVSGENGSNATICVYKRSLSRTPAQLQTLLLMIITAVISGFVLLILLSTIDIPGPVEKTWNAMPSFSSLTSFRSMATVQVPHVSESPGSTVPTLDAGPKFVDNLESLDALDDIDGADDLDDLDDIDDLDTINQGSQPLCLVP